MGINSRIHDEKRSVLSCSSLPSLVLPFLRVLPLLPNVGVPIVRQSSETEQDTRWEFLTRSPLLVSVPLNEMGTNTGSTGLYLPEGTRGIVSRLQVLLRLPGPHVPFTTRLPCRTSPAENSRDH